MADDQSSIIPSVVDGLTVQRTSLLCVFKKDFSDYMSSKHCACCGRHGNQNLVTSIMAQNYDNINLLQSSTTGAAELSSITRYLFHYSDQPLLKYLILYEEYHIVSDEPTWLMPVIPMVLVNGGIGANYNPRDVIANVRRRLNGEELVPMEPWYKWFQGTIQKNTETSYTTLGVVEERKNKLFITELPIGGKSAQEYEEFLKAAALSGEDRQPFIQDYIARHYDGGVTFEVIMSPNQMNKARQEGFHKKFELTTDLDTSNMYLLDAGSREKKKYGSLEEIFEDFFAIRLEYYKKRKLAMLDVVGDAIAQLESRDSIYYDVFSEVTTTVWHDKNDEVLYAELKNNHFLRSEEYCPCDEILESDLHTELYAKMQEFDILGYISAEELWLHDLDALEEQLNKQYEKEAKGRKKWIPPVSDYESEKQEPSKVRSSSLEEDVSLNKAEMKRK